MKTATSFNTSSDTVFAVKSAYADLTSKLGGVPSWMAVHGTYQHSGETITAVLQSIAPGVPFQGGTSCLGLMTEEGFHSENGVSFGLFGILDSQGVYGVGGTEAKSFSRDVGKNAITNALIEAGKDESPSLVWITCAPGDEEGIIAGVEEGLSGANVPIIGGSSADNAIDGKWYQLINGQVFHHGAVVTAMYPSSPTRYAFDSSYKPTLHRGIITRASGRTVFEINHRPAADIYNEWTRGSITEFIDGGNILSASTLHPLGRKAMWTRDQTFYQLAHPEMVLKNRAISLFTKVEVGEQVVLMETTKQDLVYRVDKVTSRALAGITDPENRVAGALIIYCAGCMLAVQNEMQAVADEFRKRLGGKPFLGLHTFGEQGCALLGENTHANLMMSIIIFEE